MNVHAQVKKAIESGVLVRPAECSRCAATDRRIVGHHEDYDKPLEVVWLCESCHVARHQEPDAPRNPDRPRPPEGYQVLRFEADRDLISAFKVVAKHNNRTMSGELRFLIARHVERAEA